MKVKRSFMTRVISILLVITMLLLSSCASEEQNAANVPDFLEQEDEASKALREEIGMEVLKNEDNTVSYIVNGKYGKFELKYEEETGKIFYIDSDGEYLLKITGVSADGIVSWRIEKENEILEGEINTSDTPTPQMPFVIAGTTVVISNAVYYAIIAAGTVVIAGSICYVASKVGESLKKNSNYNYFPAYLIHNNVYVSTKIGLPFISAVIRIKWGQNVWATSGYLAKSVCRYASPIGCAEYGWEGNRNVNYGYYPHYHAVKYYTSSGKYVHTGAHCWFSY